MRVINPKVIFLSFFAFIYFQSAGGTTPRADSLNARLKEPGLSKPEKIRLHNELFNLYEETDYVKATENAVAALVLSGKTTPSDLMGTIFFNLGKSYVSTDSGKNYLLLAMDEFRKSDDTLLLAGPYNTYGNYLADDGIYEEALSYYLKALRIYEYQKKEPEIAALKRNIALLYSNVSNYEMCFLYNQQALELFKKLNDRKGYAMCLIVNTEYYFSKDDTLSLLNAIREQIDIFRELNLPSYESYAISNMADVYMDYLDKPDSAVILLQKSLSLIDTLQGPLIYINSLRKIARALNKAGRHKEGLTYMKEAVARTDTSNKITVMYNELMLTYLYISLKDEEKAVESLERYRELNSEISSEDVAAGISNYQVRYETEKKENQIKILQKEKKISRLFLWGLAATIVLLASISFFIIRMMRSAKTIAEQKLNEAEKNRQLIATNSLLEGEETERRRLARDLHDGLGGLLSGLRFSLSNVKGNAVTTEETARQFDHAIDLLDTSIKELRRVAHNMMPEALMKLGLKDALSDFCRQVSRDQTFSLSFQYYGSENRLPQKYEISLYRIAQELVNNAIRHSKASEITLQLVNDFPRVHLTAQDNGTGFDPAVLTSTTGIGLNSIKSRVGALNGRLDLYTESGKGTEISIELTIEKQAGNE